jgi:flagellar basal-body rod protein FlgB
MNINYNKAIPLVNEALNSRALRQDLISSNIANVDTPLYRPRDIEFESVLSKQADEVFNNSKQKDLALAKTSNMHLSCDEDGYKSTLFFRDGHMARNDGNSVDLDVETTEMSKNSVMFNALLSGLRKASSIFNNVLDSSSRIQ